MYKIYCLKNKENEIAYVGMTKQTLNQRMSGHIKEHPHRKDYTIQQIEEVENKSLAIERETYYIKFYDTVNKGENITYGIGSKGTNGNIGSFKTGNKYGSMGTKSVVCLDTNIVYKSLTECSLKTGCDVRKISDCCKNKRKSTHGLHFQYCDL